MEDGGTETVVVRDGGPLFGRRLPAEGPPPAHRRAGRRGDPCGRALPLAPRDAPSPRRARRPQATALRFPSRPRAPDGQQSPARLRVRPRHGRPDAVCQRYRRVPAPPTPPPFAARLRAPVPPPGLGSRGGDAMAGRGPKGESVRPEHGEGEEDADTEFRHRALRHPVTGRGPKGCLRCARRPGGRHQKRHFPASSPGTRGHRTSASSGNVKGQGRRARH